MCHIKTQNLMFYCLSKASKILYYANHGKVQKVFKLKVAYNEMLNTNIITTQSHAQHEYSTW